MTIRRLCFLGLMALVLAVSGVQAESIGLLERAGGMAALDTVGGSTADRIAAFDTSEDTGTIRAGIASQQFLQFKSGEIRDAAIDLHPSGTQGITSPFHPEPETTQVPEPATLLLLATGLIAGAVRRRQMQRNS